MTFNKGAILVYCLLLYGFAIMSCSCKTDDLTIVDMVTPRNASLSAFYKRSFAFYTVKERLPRILTQTIDILVRNKDNIGNEYGHEAKEDLKTIIGEISKLKYEIQTNKSMTPLVSSAPDAKFYNNYLAKQTNATYFTTIWLHTECYMYRRLREVFELSNHLKSYDPFRIQKQESYVSSLSSMQKLASYLVSLFESETVNVKEEFVKLLKLNLWGNKCDLSFTNGTVEEAADPFVSLRDLEQNILSDESEQIWEAVSNVSTDSQIIDIVFDNAGYEVFTDLCLADFLITNNLAKEIRLYVKTIPWFVSDVMTYDFNWMLNQLSRSENASLKTLGERWTKYAKDNTWKIVEDDFFTLPVDYSYMANENPTLYRKLAEAKFIIFKGDLNYRKLFGEKNWDPAMPCTNALQGFGPSKLCTLRTIKCHCVCGLKKGELEEIEQKDPVWMETGKYGLIQFSDNVRALD